jgi:predicted metal-dependent peptidase
MMNTDKEERKLKKVKINLMRQKEFARWSALMMVGKTELSDTVPTAYTNGRDEVYGRAFVKALSEKELAFVILHENLHKAFRHLTTWQKLFKECAPLTNAACDYVINLMLVDMDPGSKFLAMPQKDGKDFGLLDRRFAGMHTKQVYDILKEEGNGNGEGEGEGFDEHGWAEAQELTEAEKKELDKEIDRALRQGEMQHAKLNGKGDGNTNRELGELLEPQVNWKDALREFVKSICMSKDASSWRRVNRRYISQGIYMPSLIGERVGRIAIGVDMSGSTWSGNTIGTFFTEVKAIVDEVKPEAIDLIYWDSHVAGHEQYDVNTIDSLMATTKPVGGGGTNPRCMQEYMRENDIKPECIIMLTDGEIGDWGDAWNAPIMWVIANKYRSGVVAPNGTTIAIKDN